MKWNYFQNDPKATPTSDVLKTMFRTFITDHVTIIHHETDDLWLNFPDDTLYNVNIKFIHLL
jgi:hypothetical protein